MTAHHTPIDRLLLVSAMLLTTASVDEPPGIDLRAGETFSALALPSDQYQYLAWMWDAAGATGC